MVRKVSEIYGSSAAKHLRVI